MAILSLTIQRSTAQSARHLPSDPVLRWQCVQGGTANSIGRIPGAASNQAITQLKPPLVSLNLDMYSARPSPPWHAAPGFGTRTLHHWHLQTPNWN